MNLYAVAFTDHTVEFYFADDREHAREQGEDANGSGSIYAIAMVPADYVAVKL